MKPPTLPHDSVLAFQMTGQMLWPETYAKDPDDGHAMGVVLGNVNKHGIEPWMDQRDVKNLVLGVMGAAKWVDGGCRMIETTAEYFSAMAATNYEGVTEDLIVPWPAFLVKLPKGLFVDSDGVEYRNALVSQFTGLHQSKFMPAPTKALYAVRNQTIVWVVPQDGNSGTQLHSFTLGTIAEMLDEKDLPFDVSGPSVEELKEDQSILSMVKRGILGLLLTMQHTNHFRTSPFRGVGKRGRHLRKCPPPHRIMFVGRPLSIDCSQKIRDIAAGKGRKGATPSVQTLVRGHHKRQVVGLGRKGRKVVWIEPYWRGPELAPILVRPYKVA